MKTLAGWLRERDIDPETLITWTAILVMVAGFWGLIGYAVWRLLSHG